ncbi:SRPBCC family protein [Domibacillus tundrae]|uniref:SRPBCC family protein n=1 Tax=Domibacillus tundrae TaxID=1587527 RepID=UPI0006180CFA|nr:SRPBCC domain-containing protein [Domibacillus tundrae]
MGQKVEDIQQTVILDAPIEKVWAKTATAEGLEEWFMPNNFRPEAGQEFHLQSPFGPSPCKVLEIDPPNRLSFSWDTEGWIVTFLLKEIEEKTEFTVIHSGWGEAGETMPKANAPVSAVRDRMNGGWSSLVNEKLRKAVEST